MPRIASPMLALVTALAAGGCWFDADYHSGQTTCTDGRCPTGLVCSSDRVCVTPADAAVPGDAGSGADAAIDAHVAALVCGDPGELASGVAVSGTTAGRANTVSASCGGSIMTGPDAVYAIAAGSGATLELTLAGGAELAAYVLASCGGTMPSCLGDSYATPTAPLSASIGSAGTYYVIVDSELAAGSGAYTLTATVE